MPAAAAKPFIRFTHTKALRTKTLKVLDAIDTDADPTPHRDTLSGVVGDLTDAGMRFFFLDTLATLKMGFVVEQAAGLGVNSVLRIMGPTVRNVIGRMDKKQLRQVSKAMRTMMT